MGQKYKFFIKGFVLTVMSSGDHSAHRSDGIRSVEWEEKLAFCQAAIAREHLAEDVIVKVDDVPSFVTRLIAGFKHIIAAGGYVLNNHGQLLMIFRRGHWDLPKGKLDEGETDRVAAVREVQEECGVGDVHIASDGFSTFHIYADGSQTIVKESRWFKMFTDHSAALVPQQEEDIEEATWVTVPVDPEILEGAYPSIREVLAHFQA